MNYFPATGDAQELSARLPVALDTYAPIAEPIRDSDFNTRNAGFPRTLTRRPAEPFDFEPGAHVEISRLTGGIPVVIDARGVIIDTKHDPQEGTRVNIIRSRPEAYGSTVPVRTV